MTLSACGTAQKPAPTGEPAAQLRSLTSAQKKLVSDGVRQMVEKQTASGGERAKLSGIKAFGLGPQGRVHVCGDVSYQIKSGTSASSAPFYLELEGPDGAGSARRGQVGFDPLKKSKVNFMCRHVSGE